MLNNVYAYAGDNPVRNLDPRGLAFTSVDSACAMDPGFCSEIMGQMVQNAGALSNNQCIEAEADKIADGLQTIGAVAGLAIVGSVASDAIQLHHAFPKYLGGDADQLLEALPIDLHNLYHRGLDQIAPRWYGTNYYTSLPPAELAQVYQAFAAYTRAFDAKFGTMLMEAAVREGFPQ